MESNKINKKQLFSLVGIVLVILALMALFRCSIKPTKQTVFSRYYVVTKSTGLYEKLDFDSEQIGILSVGDKLFIPGGNTTPECKTISEDGITMNLCYLRSEDKGSGWVLSKWIELVP